MMDFIIYPYKLLHSKLCMHNSRRYYLIVIKNGKVEIFLIFLEQNIVTKNTHNHTCIL